MITLHFTAYRKQDDGTTTANSDITNFDDRVVAEDITHAMECGVFDTEEVRFTVNKIVYDLEYVEEEI
jgi:hypothetical protein